MQATGAVPGLSPNRAKRWQRVRQGRIIGFSGRRFALHFISNPGIGKGLKLQVNNMFVHASCEGFGFRLFLGFRSLTYLKYISFGLNSGGAI